MNEKNILLISMSTLNYPEESYYENIEKGNSGSYKSFFRGVSQLEAGTKFFLRKLQKSGKTERKIDGIFIVESVMSRKPLAQEEQSVWASFLDGIVPKENLSAVDFYKERIKQYIQGKEKSHPKDEKEEALNKKIIAYENRMASLESLYDVDKLFIDIEFNDDSDEGKTNNNAIYQCVNKLCEEIEEIQKFAEDGEGISKTNLFLDIQGARRYESFIINASVKMLESRGITVESSVATDYSRNTNAEGKFNRIVDTTFNDRIFEMVSGMNEFIKTGRGDTLQEFLEHSTINLTDEKEIIDSIQKISDAISLCDVKGFDEGLQEFRVNIETYNKLEGGKDSLFQTFVKDLKNDYDEYHLLETLTEENKAVSNKTLDQIRWCLKKKLYQQALTLVEAKIPDYLVDHKFIYYKNDDELKNLINSFADNGEYDTEGRWNWKWRLEKYFYDMADENEISEEPHRWIKPGKEKYVWIKNVIGWKPFYKEDPMAMQPDEIIGLGVKAPFMYERVNLSRGRQNTNNIAIAKVLFEYRKMCIIRNEVNHAFETDAPPVSAEDVEDAINVFLDMIQECGARVDLYKYN